MANFFAVESGFVPWARRTDRLDYVIHHLGLALGGRPRRASPRLRLSTTRDFRSPYQKPRRSFMSATIEKSIVFVPSPFHT
jgi:hypothetical protein